MLWSSRQRIPRQTKTCQGAAHTPPNLYFISMYRRVGSTCPASTTSPRHTYRPSCSRGLAVAASRLLQLVAVRKAGVTSPSNSTTRLPSYAQSRMQHPDCVELYLHAIYSTHTSTSCRRRDCSTALSVQRTHAHQMCRLSKAPLL